MNRRFGFLSVFFFALSSRTVLTSEESPAGSCGTLCTCMEKDGVLHLNCEERHVSQITAIKVPLGVPFNLNLYKNNLVDLRPEDLEGLRNVISLHLGANSIQQLEPGVFRPLGSLKKLHINRNFLVMLQENTFQGLVNLEYLQADTNLIRVIEPGAFSKLVRLKVLILNDNSLEFLPSNLFRFVPLTHLDLRGNRLQSLPYLGFLEHIGRIMELLLEDNSWVCDCAILPMKIWMENVPTQSSIGEVVCGSPPQLKGSVLRRVKREALCLAHRDVDLEEPSKSLDMVVTPSNKVTQTTRSMNAKDDSKGPTPPHAPGVLCSEKCSCFKYSTAGFLIHCPDRGIQRISDIGLLQQSPTKLVLAGNMIQRLFRYDFIAYENLELLDLAGNQIDYIDNETFFNLANLKIIYLNGNRLDQLSSGIFVGLHNLEQLYLEYNVIENILPGTFKAVPNLKHLSLNSNRLKTFPSQIFRHVPLIKLNLRNNLFTYLPVSNVLDQLDSLQLINLEENPWNCGCDLVGLKQWVEKLPKDAVVGRILCQTPEKMAKTELRTVRHEVMCPGLVTFYSLPANGVDWYTTTTGTTTAANPRGFLHSLTEAVPLSVFILSLLILFLIVIFCAAGFVVWGLHHRKRSKDKGAEDQPRENSPIQLQYSMYGQKTTRHRVPQVPQMNMYEEPSYSPFMQVCRNPACCACHKEHDGFGTQEPRGDRRSIMEKENDSPLTGSSPRFRVVAECPADFVALSDSNSLYQNIIVEGERELQQLGIAEYIRKNLSQLQPPLEVPVQGRREGLKLMEMVYASPRKVLLEQTKNEYFELKASVHKDPDYLEVVENQTTLN